ncbi:hypothetical protein CK203_099585 [Vitis vinifera]|uniref:Uncharacterized protein n=1 Tax=Vitis vinifera TaxID=29760 RepID=A0A438CHL4_VITVI|nr:hypothetical protein CK203_099585 [Vitis vinifera]
MKEGLRGRRRWFAVESKSFELLIDDVGGKLIGGGDDRSWSLVWEERGRKYRLECRSNKAGRFFLCSVHDLETKRFCLIFPKGKGLIGGWNILAKKLREIGVVPSGGLKDSLSIEVLRKENELKPRTFAGVAKSKTDRLGGKVWLELEMREMYGRLEQLDHCLVDRLNLVVLGRGLMLFEFELLSEVEHVLARGKRRFKNNVLLKKWYLGVGCFCYGANTNEAWVRVVGLLLHLWSRKVFKLIGTYRPLFRLWLGRGVSQPICGGKPRLSILKCYRREDFSGRVFQRMKMKQGEDHAPCAVEACWKMSFSPKCILEYKMCRPLKETKMSDLSLGVVRSLGVGRFLECGALNVRGVAGGVVFSWDNRVLELVGMEEELGAIHGLWNDPWCIGRDFNVIKFPNERRRGENVSSLMRRFLEVIDDLDLRDLPLQGGVVYLE